MLIIEKLENDIKLNKLDFKSYLKYYKLAILLKDQYLYEVLSNVVPIDINSENEEMYSDVKAILVYKQKYV